jgi:hypothetical protein
MVGSRLAHPDQDDEPSESGQGRDAPDRDRHARTIRGDAGEDGTDRETKIPPQTVDADGRAALRRIRRGTTDDPASLTSNYARSGIRR